ncbi:lytic transglycosylase domain-containing protein [Caballeronia sp. TF1N1]|uniref:lytic transglycosylase domain-containing protein n=1 Tax=Caballeronia sp. TF1N1 TaxID=2878153 RepID=UPI001FCFD65D|nr:lytic transglycosylase domain-containing protein [Caballeronia sp. TF1N1]
MLKSIPIVAALIGLLAVSSAYADDFEGLAEQCAPNIHVRTLSALVRQESAGNPFAINVNGSKPLSRRPESLSEARIVAADLLAHGVNFDVGLGQINSANFRYLGMSADELLSPCSNLKAAAYLLSDCYQRASALQGEGQSALHAALSCYNTGSFKKGIANGYVQKVAAHVTLPVPELLPLGQSEPRQTAPVMRKPVQAGEPDAFSASGDADAFAETQENGATDIKTSKP